MAMVVLMAAVSPSGNKIDTSVPLTKASTSWVAFAVSISTNDSPSTTLSPTAFSHRTTVPSSIPIPILGRTTFVAIRNSLYESGHSSHDLLLGGIKSCFQCRAKRHVDVGRAEAENRSLETIEG